MNGSQLLLQCDYKKAIPLLRKEARRNPNKNFRIGATCEVGAALLLSGEFIEAEAYFRQLMATAMYRVSLHQIYLGLSYWYRHKWKSAFACWEQGLKSQYSALNGLDVPFVLFYASLRHRGYISVERAREIILAKREQLSAPGNTEYHIAAYLLGEIDDAHFQAKMLNKEGRNLKARLAKAEALIAFYTACRRLAGRDRRGFDTSIRESIQVTGHQFISPEDVIARGEVTFCGRRP